MLPLSKSARFVVLCFLTGLSGCESMSVSECRVADWSRVGFNDGAAGTAETRIADYTEDCGKAGVTANATAYRQGWDSGIQRYCTAANGWREGVQGRSGKDSVCVGQPGHSGFSRFLESGLRVYRTQEQISRNSSEIGRMEMNWPATQKTTIRNEFGSRCVIWIAASLACVISLQNSKRLHPELVFSGKRLVEGPV